MVAAKGYRLKKRVKQSAKKQRQKPKKRMTLVTERKHRAGRAGGHWRKARKVHTSQRLINKERPFLLAATAILIFIFEVRMVWLRGCLSALGGDLIRVCSSDDSGDASAEEDSEFGQLRSELEPEGVDDFLAVVLDAFDGVAEEDEGCVGEGGPGAYGRHCLCGGWGRVLFAAFFFFWKGWGWWRRCLSMVGWRGGRGKIRGWDTARWMWIFAVFFVFFVYPGRTGWDEGGREGRERGEEGWRNEK